LIVLNFRIAECQALFVQEHRLLVSSIILPHKPKSKNQPLFSNSTKLNCSNAAVTLLCSHKANSVAHSTDSISDTRAFQFSSNCCMLLRQPLHRKPLTENIRST